MYCVSVFLRCLIESTRIFRYVLHRSCLTVSGHTPRCLWRTPLSKGDTPINARFLRFVPLSVSLFLPIVLASGESPALAQKASVSPSKNSLIPPRDPSLPPDIKASSAILIDAVSGQVLFEKNADVKRPPASTTKIMTALLLLENTKPTDILKATKTAAATGESSMNLHVGEKITAQDMLYALLLRSANDGCVMVAEHIDGSEKRFAQRMTAKAKEIGCLNTTFRNANGLNENPNVTTARDLAIMARYASRYPAFNEATRTKWYTITRSKENKDTLMKNHAKFLWHFPGADGVKTGYTIPAGHCFVGGATWNNWRLITVVLNSPDWQGETGALMKYGFSRFEPFTLVAKGQSVAEAPLAMGTSPSVAAVTKEELRVVRPKGQKPNAHVEVKLDTLTAPISEGTVIGNVEISENGTLLGSTPLYAAGSVERIAEMPLSVRTTSNGGTGGLLLGGGLGTAAIIYGTTLAKTARRKRNSLEAVVRESD